MKSILMNVIGLIAAIAVFSGSAAYAAANMEQAVPVNVSSEQEPQISSQPESSQEIIDVNYIPPVNSSEFFDDFLQNDIGIADLLEGNGESSSQSSDKNSSATSSKTPTSSKPVSSKPVSSKPTSSKPVSSAPSSAPVSSEPISSETSSEEASEPENSDDNNDYSELVMILSGAVQREIVGTNTTPSPSKYEAYKAQAVASHSYMEYHKAKNGSYPTMPYSTPHAKTIELVSSVIDELMYYNGSVINASYHAAAGGYTQSASYVWTGNAPYLQAVQSNYDDYDSTFVISTDSVESKLSAYGISVSGDPSTWFDLAGATYSDGGFVDYISVCGTNIKARTLRESIFGVSNLKSCKITDISVSGNNLVFSTKGYGHGAGMSQLGALGLASNDGWSYKDILSHYYSGVTIR